ncbi:hypothetical protein PI124_g10459 [Phytophthora idaei]|nr:hypothetical protein PI125_g3602 [Phytophthora idaei]KAG3148411.1 hypothetical protein PI126_g12461 [Phytophthora idaei]KAG3244770.1 hypothetical protein PI124_g10459 [Phytophthora idaei]
MKARVETEKAKCTGGMFALVDLADAEYTGEGLARNSKEQKESREINSNLLALKESELENGGSRPTKSAFPGQLGYPYPPDTSFRVPGFTRC